MADDMNNGKLSPLKRAFLALEEANRRVDELESRRSEPIAIVGMGCRFPGGATSPERFWELLRNGRDAVTEIPENRWDVAAHYDEDPKAPGKMSVRRGAFIGDVDKFDAEFFGISPREARSMDPQQRILLEVTWQALEDAAIDPTSLHGSSAGVFVGMCKSDYGAMHRASGDPERYGIYPTAGGAYSMASGRISYCLGLHGPSTTIDTACSSSLVALHAGCQSLLLDECGLALVGGVNLILSPENTISFSKAEMMSPDGVCKTFDAGANGFVQGEGCGVVVIKRLSDALADGDQVLAVIRSTAVNQDGPSSGLTAPNGAAQQDVIRTALNKAGLAPTDLSYVEAHGTGTSLGDPIEVRALAAVLCDGRTDDVPLRVGSVKTNMGHLESAAGLASLIKTVLSLRHGQIPPHLHLDTPTPHVDWDNIPLVVPTELTDWVAADGPRTAGVSSFGFSGTNVHVIVSEAPEPPSSAMENGDKPAMLVLSAKNDTALDDLIAAYDDYLRSAPDVPLETLCKTAAVGKAHFAARVAVCADSCGELREGLRAAADRDTGELVKRGRRTKSAEPRVAFLFSGQGSQYAGMGKELYARHAVFRDAIDRCDELLRQHAEFSLLDILHPQRDAIERANDSLKQTRYAQPALFSFEYALASLWMSWGVKPSAVAGHSLGEYVAACIAGLFELEDAVRLVAARGRLMQSLPSDGKMAAVFAPHVDVAERVGSAGGTLSIAAVNGPRNTVISGNGRQVEEFVAAMAGQGIECQELHVSHAFHSPLMAPMLDDFAAELRATTFGKLDVSLVSNVSGAVARTADIAHPEYWLQHILEPVRFHESMQALSARGCEIFVEVGPHPVLTTLGQTCLEDDTLAWIPSLRRPGAQSAASESTQLLGSLAEFYTSGGDVDWQALLGRFSGDHVSLPTYPFQRKRHWFDTSAAPQAAQTTGHHPLLGARIDTPLHTAIFRVGIAAGQVGFVDDHKVHGNVVLPATAYLEMACAAAQECDLGQVRISDLTLAEALLIPASGECQVQVVLDAVNADWNFRVFSKCGSEGWALHCEAVLKPASGMISEPAREARLDGAQGISADEFYGPLFERGLQFGSSLRGVSSIERIDGEAVSRIEIAERVRDELSDYRFHPAVLDACLQTIGAAVPGYRSGDSESPIYMPIALDDCYLQPLQDGRLICHATVRESAAGGETMSADVQVHDDHGTCVALLHGLRLKRVSAADLAASQPADWLYTTDWREIGHAPAADSAGLDISPADIVAETGDTYQSLRKEHELDDYYRELPRLESICVGFIWQALQELGWAPRPGEVVDMTQLSQRLGVIPAQQRLLGRFLQILAAEGVLRRDGSGYVVSADSAIPEPNDALRELLAEWPGGRAEAELVARCGPALARVLNGSADPLELLFPGGDTEAGAAIYVHSPLARVFNTTVAAATGAIVDKATGQRKLRLLEIGGGTGGTTRFVLENVDTQLIDYTFTDLGGLFVSRAEERFSDVDNMSFDVLDIETDPEAQGFPRHSFDIVVAANVIHATKCLDTTMRHVKKLLAPGGLLVMTEIVARQNWIDLTFGMTEGWWHFTDADLRADYPLLDESQWQDFLGRCGFTHTSALPAAGGDQVSRVLIARGPEQAEAHSAQVEVASPWLVFEDRQGAAEFLLAAEPAAARGHLRVGRGEAFSAGETCRVRGDQKPDFTALLDSVEPPAGVLFFWPLDDVEAADRDAGGPAPAPEFASCHALLNLVQALVERNVALEHGLWIVTAGGQATAMDDAAINLSQAPEWGFAKVIAQEHPELNCRIVDVEPGAAGCNAPLLSELLAAPGEETEFVIRNGRCLAPRLVRMADLSSFQGDADRPLKLESTKRGVLDTLVYRECPASPPGRNEVQIRVHTTGLNFRDVLNALGNYAGGEVPFGSECSGTVVAAGADVEEFKAGDRVLAIAQHAFSDFVTANAGLVAHKPAGMSWAEAACLPIAYTTAHVCLHAIGALQAGERVLIHAGAGGVGMAAVHLAMRAGADVFATAGSPRKRQYLRQLGVSGAFDSRRRDFVGEIESAVGERCIDVVINSLTDEFIPASLSVLRPGGRFIEIGRSEVWSEEQVSAVRDDVSYVAVDLSPDMLNPDDRMRDTLRAVVGLVAEGGLAELPVKTFSRDETIAAFRFMAQARHIGKIAIEAPLDSESLVRREGTYLVTGAFGGLGLLVANWLCENGATSLNLLGRNPPGPEADAVIRDLQGRGLDLNVIVADVADAPQMQSVFAGIEERRTPLRGILHCAGALSDAPIVQQSWSSFRDVYKAKVAGSWLLHELSKVSDLDFFVTFSSIASVLGSPGQSNHCSANSFLDLLAHLRRSMNLPAVNINWGVWSDTGAAVEHGVEERAAARGMALIQPSLGLDILHTLMRSGRTQTMVQAIDWSVYERSTDGRSRNTAFLSEVCASQDRQAAQPVAAATSSVRDDLMETPLAGRNQFLVRQVQAEVARVLRLDSGTQLPSDLPLKDAGLDSLMAVELRNSLSARLECKLPATLMFDYPTVEGVAAFVEQLIFEDSPVAALAGISDASADSDLDDLFESIENLSAEEVDRLYQQKVQEQ
jgi:acyl transferase domain-containing protein/acyl carrier protein/NADP-dependent 3-hydroxy acid dehydrogenase YdfG